MPWKLRVEGYARNLVIIFPTHPAHPPFFLSKWRIPFFYVPIHLFPTWVIFFIFTLNYPYLCTRRKKKTPIRLSNFAIDMQEVNEECGTLKNSKHSISISSRCYAKIETVAYAQPSSKSFYFLYCLFFEFSKSVRAWKQEWEERMA